MGGFLGGLGTLLGGFNVKRRIDEDGFDFREKQAQEEWERQRKQQLAGQADEDRSISQMADYLTYAQNPDEGAIESLLPSSIEGEKRMDALRAVAGGQALQSKSALEMQKAYNRRLLEGDKQEGQQELVRIKAKVAAGMPITAYEQAVLDQRGERTEAFRERTEMYRNRPVGGLAGGGGVGLTPGGLDAAAKAYATTGKMPTLGMGAAGTRQAIINRAAEMFPDVDIASNAARYGADAGALRKIAANRTAVEAFEDTAARNSEILRTALKEIPDLGVQPLNRAARSVQTMFGDKEMAEFNTALQSVRNEYARIISNPNLTGVMSDSARREGEVLLSPDATVGQILAALDVLQAEAKNRRESFAAVENELLGGFGGGGEVEGGADWVYDPATGTLMPPGGQ